ncbi:MAG: hypothetical protein ABIU05_05125 [Nitrospirales bacterium]
MFYANREDRRPVENAVREARNELLASEDEALRRCYDYLQDAREQMGKNTPPANVSVYAAAYKAMEVLKRRFGGEKQAGAVLGNVFRKAKTAANTEPHIREKFRQQPATIGKVLELTEQVIRSYEGYLLEESHKRKEGYS